MNRFLKLGEGALLGLFLCVLLVITAVVVFLRIPPAETVVPIHKVDVIITPEPLMNINTASVEALAALNGIGEVLAGRIVEWRTENGPFETIEAVMSVPGIGEAKLAMIREQICVN